ISSASDAVIAVPITLPSSRNIVERTAQLNATTSMVKAAKKRIHAPPLSVAATFRRSARKFKSMHLSPTISHPDKNDDRSNRDQTRQIHALQNLQQPLPVSPEQETDGSDGGHPQRRPQEVK